MDVVVAHHKWPYISPWTVLSLLSRSAFLFYFYYVQLLLAVALHLYSICEFIVNNKRRCNCVFSLATELRNVSWLVICEEDTRIDVSKLRNGLKKHDHLQVLLVFEIATLHKNSQLLQMGSSC